MPGFKQFRRWRKKHLRLFRPEYEANGLAVKNRNLGFLDDPRFRDAWNFAARGNREGWPRGIPNIEWRAHFACWAGRTPSPSRAISWNAACIPAFCR